MFARVRVRVRVYVRVYVRVHRDRVGHACTCEQRPSADQVPVGISAHRWTGAVTRIIAGTARGRRLAVPPGGARPTTDRVRESMFASLDHLLGGFAAARVLDLFAGSGALGLEAASRGATEVVLVERDRPTAAVARANAAAVGLPGIRIVAAPVARHLSGRPEPYDLVLADPPYAMDAAEVEAFLAELTRGWLAPDAVVMVERSTRGGRFTWPDGLVALRPRAYGSTTLWYGQAASDGEDP